MPLLHNKDYDDAAETHDVESRMNPIIPNPRLDMSATYGRSECERCVQTERNNHLSIKPPPVSGHISFMRKKQFNPLNTHSLNPASTPYSSPRPTSYVSTIHDFISELTRCYVVIRWLARSCWHFKGVFSDCLIKGYQAQTI